MSGAPFKYIKHGHTMYENFLRACEKNVLSQKWGFLKHTCGGTLQKSTFLTQNFFFDKLLENFPCIVRGCLIYLKDAPGIACYAKKKN